MSIGGCATATLGCVDATVVAVGLTQAGGMSTRGGW
jgi:hypothetical protein